MKGYTEAYSNDVYNNLKIIQINIRSIQANFNELVQTIIESKIDIAFIQET